MHIEAMQKLTLLDYPGKTAATLFTHGCNFRCPFCHNAGLVIRKSELSVSEEEVLAYLDKRKKMLDGICITGGEPLLQSDIAEFIKKVRALGYAVKLDTNGSFPEKLKTLIDEGLVDYVAVDIKNSPEKYEMTAGAKNILEKVKETVNILKEGKVDFEFRTTVCGNLHTVEDMRAIGEWLRGTKNYFIQPFKDSGDIVAGADAAGAFACEKSHAEALLAVAKLYIPQTEIRG